MRPGGGPELDSRGLSPHLAWLLATRIPLRSVLSGPQAHHLSDEGGPGQGWQMRATSITTSFVSPPGSWPSLGTDAEPFSSSRYGSAALDL